MHVVLFLALIRNGQLERRYFAREQLVKALFAFRKAPLHVNVIDSAKFYTKELTSLRSGESGSRFGLRTAKTAIARARQLAPSAIQGTTAMPAC